MKNVHNPHEKMYQHLSIRVKEVQDLLFASYIDMNNIPDTSKQKNKFVAKLLATQIEKAIDRLNIAQVEAREIYIAHLENQFREESGLGGSRY